MASIFREFIIQELQLFTNIKQLLNTTTQFQEYKKNIYLLEIQHQLVYAIQFNLRILFYRLHLQRHHRLV